MKDQWIEWLQAKQRHFFYGVTFVIAAVFIGVQSYGKLHKSNTQKYFSTHQAFQEWMEGGEAFDRLEAALKQQPELASKYAAQVVEKLMADNQPEKTEGLAANIFERALKQAPEYASFSETSLAIAKGKLEDALIQATSLKKNLNETSVLYGFNLIRVASLHRALKQGTSELTALQDLQIYLETHEQEKALMSKCFHEGEMSLEDYLIQRISLLNQ